MRKTLAALLALTAAILPSPPASGQTLTVKVSDTLLDLSQKWAEAYTAKHPGAAIHVTGDVTTTAFATLASKQADLILVSRGIRYKERQACEAAYGRRPAELKVAVSGLAVYVNPSNPVTIVNYDELAGVFQGQTQNWKTLDGGKDQPISAYALATNSVCGELFNEEALSGKGFSSSVHLLSAPDIFKNIAADPNGIGIGPFALAPGVKILSIKRVFSSTPVEPTEESISRKLYPLSRFVYSYGSPAADADQIKAYLEWVRGDDGQRVAREAGFYALPASARSTQ